MVRHVDSFSPVVDANTRVMVLGSMPGVTSLNACEYYAHPRNVFWRQMGTIFSFDPVCSYPKRLRYLLDNNLGLWDVVARCIRPGSLDSHIDRASVELNDFENLFEKHPKIKAVLFNGQKSAQLFKPVARRLAGQPVDLKMHVMPSTSPAYAAMSAEKKLECWSRIIKALL